MNRFLFVIFFITLSGQLLAQGFKGCPSGSEKPLAQNDAWEKEVLVLVNQERDKRGLDPLLPKASLRLAARYHAIDMAQEGYFEHDTYDLMRNGQMKYICGVFERIEAFDNDGSSENIAVGQESPKEVVATWMRSDGHRENILDPNIHYLGVGYAYQVGDKYGHYWVQVFGW